MPSPLPRRLLCIAGAVALAAACATPDTQVLPSVPCSAAGVSDTMDRADDVSIVADPTIHPRVRADVESYLTRMWGRPVTVQLGTPAQTADVIWISSSEAARIETAGDAEGDALVRRDVKGRRLVTAYAATPSNLATATYALLEELGARFFHPMQELVPSLGAPYLPRVLDVHRTPMTAVRGLQLHLLHPLEYLKTFDDPSDASFEEAKRFIDWLAKTGQSYFHWPLLETVPWDPFVPYAKRIIEYAHSRGIRVGTNVQVFEKASLQHAYVLVRDEAAYAEQIPAGLDQLMQVPWDHVVLSLGEFLTADPEELLVWLNLVVDHMAAIAPGITVNVNNHVGNYPNLYVPFRGQTAYFYHLPQYADPRLGMTVHSLFFYDTYREGGMYLHPNFHFQREFMMSQLPTRRVWYHPESAYWIATDIDVPAFLPEFVEARWTDIHRLDQDIRSAGLPPLEGHLTFSSGHEWGYWLTDYLVAKMLWDPSASLDSFFAHYTSAFGSCAPEIGEDLTKYVDVQRRVLFEKKRVNYVSGEDQAVDLANLANHSIREPRVKFDDLVTGGEDARAAFERDVLADLDGAVKEIRPLEDSVAARCRGADATLAPWCDELRDGMRIVRVRLEHSALLYRSVLAYGRGDTLGAAARLADAKQKTEDAAAVVAEREKGYRFDVYRVTAHYQNFTSYAFGYLRQAHVQCLWRRQDEQARRIVEEGALGSTSGLPPCLD